MSVKSLQTELNKLGACEVCNGTGLLKGTMGVKVSCFACNGTSDDNELPGQPKSKRGSREQILQLAKTDAVVAAELFRWHQGEISWEGAVNRALVSLAEFCAVQEEELAKVRWSSKDDLKSWSDRGPGPWQCQGCGGPKSTQEKFCGDCVNIGQSYVSVLDSIRELNTTAKTVGADIAQVLQEFLDSLARKKSGAK